MSQVITNNDGEQVEVLDKGDLTAVQSRVLWAFGGFFVVAVGFAWRVSAQEAKKDANTEHRIATIEQVIAENIPNMRDMQRTMDSLLIELRFMRQEIERTR